MKSNPTHRPERITLVIPSLEAGGAERVMSLLANAWAEQGHSVSLLTWDNGRQPPFYDLHAAIRHASLDIAKPAGPLIFAWAKALRRLWILRKAILRTGPGVVISFLDQANIMTLLALAGKTIPVVISERIDPAFHPLKFPWGLLRALIYPRAQALVVQTEAIKSYFPFSLHSKIHVIPNPVVLPDLPLEASRKENEILSVCSLHPRKGVDNLVKAFHALAPIFPDWSLTVVGDGPQRRELESLVLGLGLQNRVRFPGQQKRLKDFFQRCSLFALASRYEGFPNALMEAMSWALPVVATEASGARCLIEQERNGLIVPVDSVPALTGALSRLIRDSEERVRFGVRARQSLQSYSLPVIHQRWKDLLDRVLSQAEEKD